MSKSFKNIALLALGGVLLYSLTGRAATAAANFANNFTISNVKLSNIRPGLIKTKILLTVSIANFNSLPVRITGARFNLILNGTIIGSIIDQSGGTIQAQSSSDLNGNVQISNLALGAQIYEQVQNGNLQEVLTKLLSSNLTVQGEVFGTGGFSVPINQTIRPI